MLNSNKGKAMKRREFLKCFCAVPIIGVPAIAVKSAGASPIIPAYEGNVEIPSKWEVLDESCEIHNVRWRKYSRLQTSTQPLREGETPNRKMFESQDIVLSKSDIDRIVTELKG